jgi:hypothetical protein
MICACKVSHEEKCLIMSTHMSLDRMYVNKALVIVPQCLKISKTTKNQLWHQRYGHLSYKGISVLVNKNMVISLPNMKEPNEKCSNCLKGKQQKEVITNKSTWRDDDVLELIHSDI